MGIFEYSPTFMTIPCSCVTLRKSHDSFNHCLYSSGSDNTHILPQSICIEYQMKKTNKLLSHRKKSLRSKTNTNEQK